MATGGDQPVLGGRAGAPFLVRAAGGARRAKEAELPPAAGEVGDGRVHTRQGLRIRGADGVASSKQRVRVRGGDGDGDGEPPEGVGEGAQGRGTEASRFLPRGAGRAKPEHGADVCRRGGGRALRCRGLNVGGDVRQTSVAHAWVRPHGCRGESRGTQRDNVGTGRRIRGSRLRGSSECPVKRPAKVEWPLRADRHSRGIVSPEHRGTEVSRSIPRPV